MPNSANPPLLKPDFPAPTEGFVVTTLLIVSDVARSRAFYERVFGAGVLVEERHGQDRRVGLTRGGRRANRGLVGQEEVAAFQTDLSAVVYPVAERKARPLVDPTAQGLIAEKHAGV